MTTEIQRPTPSNAQRREYQRAHRLLAMVKGENVPKVEKAPEDTVLTWPYFLMIEFLAAAIFFIGLMLMSWLVSAPLEARADPNCTPNPSKAPWYFLNLQELLLHMHPALAGVIVPGVALVLLGAIPYVDRTQEGLGRYLDTPNSKPIAFWSVIISLIITPALILFDEYVGTRRILTEVGAPVVFIEVILPIILMVGLPAIWGFIVKKIWNASVREVMVALFTGFMAVFVILTIVGTAFRGTGMHLFLPWEMPGIIEC